MSLRHQDAAKRQGSAFARFTGQRRAPGSNTMLLVDVILVHFNSVRSLETSQKRGPEVQSKLELPESSQ